MIVISLLTWLIVIYSLKIVVVGNPAYDLVRSAPKAILKDAANYLEGDEIISDDSSSLFVQQFLRLTTITFVLFVVEIGILFYFILKDPQLGIPWIILVKNVIMVVLGYNAHRQVNGNVFESILDIPSWAIFCERISYLITAAGFLFLFMIFNHLIS